MKTCVVSHHEMRSGNCRSQALDSINERACGTVRLCREHRWPTGRGIGVSVLADRFGRIATDLRVSLTDRCNLRCTYCMPEEELQWLPQPGLLPDDEIVRLIDIAVTSLGIREVRFTGGEPLLRPGLVGIVERVAALEPRPQMSLTTNGIGLKRTATALKAAGLDRGNGSLGTLRPEAFKTLTRRDRHHD